ncbi:hypothetical protein [Planococcus sp. YIM B11945]|uniref:hypothetical protein n=1 Tax=Planococcus sp. YIM B11945 TaxID=3435410 RepID=UPI003D7D5A9E
MDGEMIAKIVFIILGVAILIGGIFYRKKDHDEFNEGALAGTGSDSLLAFVIIFIIGLLMSIGPWWVTKTIIMIFGITFLYLGIFLI